MADAARGDGVRADRVRADDVRADGVGGALGKDPVETDPDLYHVLFENDRVRVLEYRDEPGNATHPHSHPDSVMVTLTSFRRRLWSGGKEVELELPAFQARWLGAQEHSGMNIGDSETHSIFVELKQPIPHGNQPIPLGPSDS